MFITRIFINVVKAWNAENCYFVQNGVFCIQSITIFSETQTSEYCKQSILKRKAHNNTIMKTAVSNNILMSALCFFGTAWCLSSVLTTLGIRRIRDGLSYLSHTWNHSSMLRLLLRKQCDLFLQKENIFLTASLYPSSCSKQSWLISIRCSFALLASIPSHLWSWSNAIPVSALQSAAMHYIKMQKENIILTASLCPSSCSKQSWLISIRCSFALLASIRSYLWSWSNAIPVSALHAIHQNVLH